MLLKLVYLSGRGWETGIICPGRRRARLLPSSAVWGSVCGRGIFGCRSGYLYGTYLELLLVSWPY